MKTKIYKFATTLTGVAHGWKEESIKEREFFIEYKLDDGEDGHWNTRVKNAMKALEVHNTIPAVFLVGQIAHRYELCKITDTTLSLVPERERRFLIDMNKSKGRPPLSPNHKVHEIHCSDIKGHDCSETDPIEGICTGTCENRNTCTRPRVPFLVYGVVINRAKELIFMESYINDVAYKKAREGC